jgi:hypothetical protein
VSEQVQYQLKLRADRAALSDGHLTADTRGVIDLGETYVVRVRVCGPLSIRCPAPPTTAPTAPGSAPIKQPIRTGSRISANLTASQDAPITAGSSEVQAVIEPDDDAQWLWYVRPSKPGTMTLTVHLVQLRGATMEPLFSETQVDIVLKTRATFEYSARRVTEPVKNFIAWAAGILGALGITGAGLLMLRKRRRSTPPRRKKRA